MQRQVREVAEEAPEAIFTVPIAILLSIANGFHLAKCILDETSDARMAFHLGFLALLLVYLAWKARQYTRAK